MPGGSISFDLPPFRHHRLIKTKRRPSQPCSVRRVPCFVNARERIWLRRCGTQRGASQCAAGENAPPWCRRNTLRGGGRCGNRRACCHSESSTGFCTRKQNFNIGGESIGLARLGTARGGGQPETIRCASKGGLLELGRRFEQSWVEYAAVATVVDGRRPGRG